MAFIQRILDRLSHQRLRVGDDPSASVADYSKSFSDQLAALRHHDGPLEDHEIHFATCGINPNPEYIRSIRAELEDMANNMVLAAKSLESLEKAIHRREKQPPKQQGRGYKRRYVAAYRDTDEDDDDDGGDEY